MMNNKTRVSVIVPVYNTERYLKECVNSIICQTYTQIELILVDDGSSDGSPDICERFASLDSRIKVIHKQNGGVVSARIAGINASSGCWITFVDADDTIEYDMIECMVDKTDEGVDLVVFHSRGDWGKMGPVEYANHLFSYERVQLPGKLFRNTLLKQTIFDIPRYFRVGEDFLQNLQILPHITGTVIMTSVEKYNYRDSYSSVMSSFKTDKEYEQRVIEKVDDIYNAYPISFKSQIYQQYVFFKLYHLKTMMSRGYSINASEPYVQKILRQSCDIALNDSAKIVIRAVKHPLYRIPLIVEKTIRHQARILIDSIARTLNPKKLRRVV